MINKYSFAFGPVILAFAVTGILHMSMHAVQLFKVESNLIQKVTTFGSLLWFVIMLASSAQVNTEVGCIILITCTYEEASDYVSIILLFSGSGGCRCD